MSTTGHISLHTLLSILRERIDDAFPLPYWVMAEIGEMKVNYSGHCYMELVEKGGDNHVPKAKMAAVVWRSSFGAISSYFASATGTPLAAGMKILVRVSVTFHELYGVSLNITDIDPSYTVGEMRLQRDATIARLREEGVYEMNRMLGPPVMAQRLAVVSSSVAAGYRDFMRELEASPYHFDVTLFDAFMQGAGAEESIILALERIAGAEDDFDAVVVIRGGGAQSDLGCFDSYRLCSHLAQFPLPVVTGIGHDKDTSVADLVAAMSLKTPTAVAAWFVEVLAGIDGWLADAGKAVAANAAATIERENSRMTGVALRLKGLSADMIRQPELRLERYRGELSRLAGMTLSHCTAKAALLGERIELASGSVIERERVRLSAFEAVVRARDPRNILSLGFAIVRFGGKAVSDAAALSAGDKVEITLAMGSKGAIIDR